MAGTVTGEVAGERREASGPGRRGVATAAVTVAVVALLVFVIAGGLRSAALVPLLALGVLASLLQALAAGARRRRGTRHRPHGADPEPATEVRQFRVTEPSGRAVDCVLVGELRGAPLRRGDVVEVYGRTHRTGTVRAREVVVVADRQTVRARRNLGFLAERAVTPVVVALAATGTLGVAAVLLMP